MATINLVTGYTGEAHVKSEEDALLNRYLLGQSSCVINLTNTFGDTDCDVNCDCVLGGRLIRTDGSVNLTFTKPSSGYYRYDGIYIVYKKATNGVESAELVYCEGTESPNQSTAIANEGTPEPGTPIPADFTYIQLYEIEWNTTQQKNVIKNSAYDIPKLNGGLTARVDGYGEAGVDIGYPTYYEFPLIGGFKLCAGTFQPTNVTKAIDPNTSYEVSFRKSDGSTMGNIIARGMQVTGRTNTEQMEAGNGHTINDFIGARFKASSNGSAATINITEFGFTYWWIMAEV